MRPLPIAAMVGALICAPGLAARSTPASEQETRSTSSREGAVYRPRLAVPAASQRFLKHLDPGEDGFALERPAQEIEARLGEWARALRTAPAAAAIDSLLAPGFRGAKLSGEEPSASASVPLEIQRARDLPREPTLDARAFTSELQRLTREFREIAVAEFLITAIEPETPSSRAPEPRSSRAPEPRAPEPRAPELQSLRTSVRYDLVGTGAKAFRVEHVGAWEMTWRKQPSGWQIVRWTAAEHLVSRARAPIFTEITAQALAHNDSFRQLNVDLDARMATLDSVLTRDSNGHHGVSVGDADGDGLEDLYVAQPAGMPNRLYRNRGDSTFEDVTARAGVGVLDDTAQSLFADVDNDGDQDLVLATATQPLLFVNDGKARFTPVPEAFKFAQPLQGVLTSISMADYDRDGFLDLYLCVYSYFFGAGEDKAGTPAPYYDARNGPPAVLFRNDGRGRFVDATGESGLGANNQYHFAAAWADYDEDGWPDLLVANDFGTKNLYRNLGRRNGVVMFEDAAKAAGVLDHGAGMSAAFLDYDNDGRLDIYTGNMWSAPGLRVTAAPSFLADETAEVRALYRRHARGNSLFRNLGGGRFEDRTIAARAGMGRWSWASDALDFDNDGWDDLYVVNGMLTRKSEAPGGDLEGFFWRQVVAHSPRTRMPGTPYDDAWRAINQLLIHGSIASRQRNVFLRNDGHGGFDEISGALGLDLDQDGRSFAVIDLDRDGDQDLVVMAARQAPQLRIFRNDFASLPAEGASIEGRARSIAVRLTGTKSNRDAIGARVIVEADRMRRTRIVQAGSGFLSQHSREQVIGLGQAQRAAKLTIVWPSGETQSVADVPLNTRVQIVEGGDVRMEPLAPHTAAKTAPVPPPDSPSADTWLYEPFPAPDFSLKDVSGTPRSLAALGGKPAIVLLWSFDVPAARAALDALGRGAPILAGAGVGAIAIAIDPPKDPGALQAVAPIAVPVAVATREVGLSYAILNRHLFMNRQDLRLPTGLLLDAGGNVVRAYRDGVNVAQIVKDAAAIDATPTERLARALPFPGTFYAAVPLRNYLPYGSALLDEGLDAAAVVAFERAAQANPGASTLYRLGTLLTRTGEKARARSAFERALALQPDLAEANNDLGALLAQAGDLDAAIGRFRAALSSMPDYPDALNNLGYALLLAGQNAEAQALYEKALALQPDFPEALNNLGLLFGRAGDMDQAEKYFRAAVSRRADYGEGNNNLALVLIRKGQTEAAVELLEGLLKRAPDYDASYITLAKIYYAGGRTADAINTLERLLQRHPEHIAGLEMLRLLKRD